MTAETGFVVWVDGKKDEAFFVGCFSLEEAYTALARKYGCIDELDYVQEHGFDDSPFNSCSPGEAAYYGVAHALPN